MADRWDRLSNIAFVVACVVLGSIAVGRQVWPSKPAVVAREHPIVVGSEAAWARVDRTTAFVFISSECRFCEESIPLYKSLTKTASSANNWAIQFVALAEPKSSLQDYLKQRGLTDAVVVDCPMPRPAKGTPTVIVIGPDRKVIASWEGRLGTAQEKQLVNLLKSAPRFGL